MSNDHDRIKYDKRKFEAYQNPGVFEAEFNHPLEVEKKKSWFNHRLKLKPRVDLLKLRSLVYRLKQKKLEKIWIKQLESDRQHKKSLAYDSH